MSEEDFNKEYELEELTKSITGSFDSEQPVPDIKVDNSTTDD